MNVVNHVFPGNNIFWTQLTSSNHHLTYMKDIITGKISKVT